MSIQASELRVSTMTITGHLGAVPNLQGLFDTGILIPYWWIGEGIIKIEFAGQKKGECMEDILHVSNKTKKRFFNQSSLVFRLELDAATVSYKEINIKLFKNGGFQMTGISSEEMARAALERLIVTNRHTWPTESNPHIQKFDICMINSDYSINKVIRRDRLYKTLVETYGLWSTYEPTIYQGVNTKFFWNKTRQAGTPPGICVCPDPCEGGGDGYSIGACKKITIAPFRTGKIIITGAKCMEQLHDAYAFMNMIFEKHAGTVLRDPPTLEAVLPRKKPGSSPTTTEGVIKQKMRTSPRNIVNCGHC